MVLTHPVSILIFICATLIIILKFYTVNLTMFCCKLRKKKRMTEINLNGGIDEKIETCKPKELIDLCEKNANVFKNDNTENGQRLYLSLLSIKDNISNIVPICDRIEKSVKRYDFDENTPGNGYRSFLNIYKIILDYSIELNKKVSYKCESVLFRKAFYTKEVESCSQIVASIGTCLSELETLMTWCAEDGLVPTYEHDPYEIYTHASKINQYCFYGRHVGLQFCQSMQNVLRFIVFSMAVFSEAYYSQGSIFSKATNSVMTTTKYMTDPEERAKRIVNVFKFADIHFLKAFWFLSESELMRQLPSVVAQSVAVCRVIQIPPEPLSLNINGTDVVVPVPTSHVGKKPIQVRLISYHKREGMIGEANSKNNVLPRSRGLVIHCHGGGFVAQSSKSHEPYLRQWAKEIGVPILSIDYSLAPEAPFPRALEEVTYVYAWALKNYRLLGSTGERIIAAGDSAGGNLWLATTLKCLHIGLPPPMGLFLAYSATLVSLTITPSRLLGILDPIVPFTFLVRCVKAYAFEDTKSKDSNTNENNENTSDASESFEEISESDLLELQARKSPVSETSDTLTYGSLSSQTDEMKEQNTLVDETINQNSGQKYVSDFLEKYVLDSDTDTDGLNKQPVLIKEQIPDTPSATENTIQEKVSTFMSTIRGRLGEFVGFNKSQSNPTLNLDISKEIDILDGIVTSEIQNPFINPFIASDEDLKRFPPVKLVTTHLDPLLDENVSFAKRLKKLGNNVTLDILDGLPHGFLSLSLVCKEADEGSKFSATKIAELLDLNNLPEPLSEAKCC